MMDVIDTKSYKDNGFLILKNFFDRKFVETVLKDAKNVFFRQFLEKGLTAKASLSDLSEDGFNECLYRLFEEDLQTLTNCGKQVQHLFSLHQLSLDQKVQELLEAAGLKSPIISTRPVLYFNHNRLAQKKVFYKVDAHQDWRSMQGSLNSAVIWVPLVDVNRDLGALEVLPGSHLNGLRTDHMDSGFGMVSMNAGEEKKLVSVELKVGDVHLFSSFLIHQSGENITSRPRWSCHFRYNDLAEATFLTRGYAHPYIYKPQEELITKNFPPAGMVRDFFKTN